VAFLRVSFTEKEKLMTASEWYRSFFVCPYAKNIMSSIERTVLRAGLLALALTAIASVSSAQQLPNDLTTTSLEDLMNIEVTSVSKREEKLFQSAAAIYVITQEEIRRSGLASIPDLLRLVPGLDVARIDGTKWAVSARGFNGRFTNKLLVLIDGRSVYTPETSGVYWEAQDVLLEDIERIEVIRGPGGTLWGANAVNGVINIITKHSRDTQGSLVTTGGGSEERGFGSARYGGKISEKAGYKVYGKYFNRRGLLDAAGDSANDGQQALRGGGRLDWELTERDSLSLQGEIYRTNLRETVTNISPAAPFAPHTNTAGVFTGGHVLGRWTRTLSKGSETALQFYYDRFNRDVFDLQESISTLDLDFQHHFAMGQRHDIVWGLGYRMISDGTNRNSANPVQFTPQEKNLRLLSAFAQDEFTLIADRLQLTLGTKLEHDDYSGFEVQPTARLLWTLSNHQTMWGAVSRAVRTPSRADRGIRVNAAAFPVAGGTTAILALLGDENTTSEVLRAFELGYRVQPARKFALDIATFYNLYDRLQTLEPLRPFFESEPQPPHLVVPLRFSNLMRGETYGLEASANWNATHYWRLSGGYSFLRMQLHRYAESLDQVGEGAEGQNPRHQFQLHSFLTLPGHFDLDASLYQTSSRVTDRIPSYTRFDARLGWRVRENVELSVALQNLLDKQHPEFSGVGVLTSQPTRAAYGKLTWRF
jgi:iron complex outermembrane receptor protein